MEELNEAQKAVLANLKNPDQNVESVQYDFDKSIQQDILSLMMYERSFIIQTMPLIKPEYFIDKAHNLICKIIFEWFERYVRRLSGEQEEWIHRKYILDQLELRLKDNPAKSYYVAELETILDSYVQGLTNKAYCLERVTGFAKDQEIKIAISKTVDLLKSHDRDKHDRIKLMWDKAFLVGPQMDLGLNYFEDIEKRYIRMAEDRSGKDRFSMGFAEIDESVVGHGLSRGEIGAYEAMSGVGKSFLLCKAAIENIRMGHRVALITLEMNQDKTAERIDTLLTGVSMSRLLENKLFVKKTIETQLKMAMTAFLDKLPDDDKNRLMIKHFSAGTADINTIRAYYSQLALHGFKPDLLLVDYVGELKDFPGMKTYESRQRLVRDLRAFGVDEDHCTLTAMQANRSGRFAQEDGFIDDSEIGDSYGQVRVMDLVCSINQTKKEKSANVGRIFIIKNRNGKSRYHFCYYQDPEKLTYQTISEDEWKERCSAVKDIKNDESPMVKFEIPDASNFDGTRRFEQNGGEE